MLERSPGQKITSTFRDLVTKVRGVKSDSPRRGWIVPFLSDEDKRQRKHQQLTELDRLNNVERIDIPADHQSAFHIPQAVVEERLLTAYEDRDWRTFYAQRLQGKGLEIGPLHRPMNRHAGMEIDYVDRYSVEDLKRVYPELGDTPLVEPNIIADAEELDGVTDQTYDFTIAAHVIEHMKNPIKALNNWRRVTKPGGLIYLIVPDKRNTFDKQRVRTTLQHLILDYRKPSEQRDLEHYLDYVVQVHGYTGDDAVSEALKLASTDYSIHFHVFIPTDIVNLINWFNENVAPLRIDSGPTMSPGSDEFHLMLQIPA